MQLGYDEVTIEGKEGVHDGGMGPKFIFLGRSQTTEVVTAQIVSLCIRKQLWEDLAI
jgi:hypothetical protein